MTSCRLPNGETAGDLMVRQVPKATATMTVGSVLESFAGRTFDNIHDVYVVSPEGNLEGVVSIGRLLEYPRTTVMASIMTREPASVRPEMDQEKAAAAASNLSLSSVPVIDSMGHLLGVITAPTLLRVLRREHVEDLHRISGIIHTVNHARDTLVESPLHRTKDRLPWLMLGLLGTFMAAAVVAHYEAVLTASIELAFFVPAIVYLADAIGTQSEAVAVRGLSIAHAPLRRLLTGEIATGALLGISLGSLAALLIGFVSGDMQLSATVGLTITAAGTLAAALGLLLPWLLSRSGADPAYGSGPVATVIQDILSLLVYFLIASAIF